MLGLILYLYHIKKQKKKKNNQTASVVIETQ